MATAAQPDPDDRPDFGRLANNYMLVQSFQGSMSRSELNLTSVPKQLRLIIAEGAWKEFLLPDGRIIRNAADFRRFIEAPRPEGCQTPIHVLRHMVSGTAVADQVEELLRGKRGGLQHETRDQSGRFHNRNNVTVVDDKPKPPAVIPMPRAEKPKRKRDYSRESKQGNSLGYVLRMLETKAPEYLDRVKAGELSAHGAAVAAGLRDKMIGVPAVPSKAARILARHFKGDDLAELIDLLTQALAAE